METTIALTTPSTLVPVPPPRRRHRKPPNLNACRACPSTPLFDPLAPSGSPGYPAYLWPQVALGTRSAPHLYRRLHISDSHPGQVVAPFLSRGPGLAQGVACFGPGLWLAPRPSACQGHPLQKAQRPGQRSSGGPLCLLVLRAVQAGIAWGRDVCLDSTLLAAWSHQDPDAAWSYLSRKGRVFGYKVHTLLDRTSRLPLFFLVTPANRHDLPWPMGCCGWPRIGCCCL
jgi:hypothetical protein